MRIPSLLTSHWCGLQYTPLPSPAQLFMLTDVSVSRRQQKLQRWFQGGGLLFLGYDMFRNMAQAKKMKKQRREAFQKFLLDPGGL